MVPKPFSRIIIRFGEPIFVPDGIDRDRFENKRQLIEKKLAFLHQDTDVTWKNQAKIDAIF